MSDPLNLENLWIPDFQSKEFMQRRALRDAEKQRFKEKYGDRWEDEYFAMLERRDAIRHRKWLNHLIYHLGAYPYNGRHMPSEQELDELDRRCREIYGDQYDEIKASRIDWDPRVAEQLIAEAIKYGNCEELPDELIDEYLKRTGDAR